VITLANTAITTRKITAPTEHIQPSVAVKQTRIDDGE